MPTIQQKPVISLFASNALENSKAICAAARSPVRLCWHHQISDTPTGGRPAGPLHLADHRAVLRQKGYGSFTWHHRWLQPVTTIRQDAQKQSRKFCRSKEGKNSETHPEKPEKGETGCVLGAGENGSGWERVKPDEKTQCPNQSEHHSHATHAKRKPAKTHCFRRFCGRGRRT